MAKRFLLEISVQTLEAAQAAERGGANRIELCAELSVGGVTPSRELLRAVREKVRIPIFSMIRPRAGDFVYSAGEWEDMKRSIAVAKEAGMDGVVVGVVQKDFKIDVSRTRELVALARPLPVTFHRVFDECGDLRSGLEAIILTGARRILTSGGATSAAEGASILRDLVKLAGNRIVILPGAGINGSNVAQVAQQTGAVEFHSGLSSALPYSSCDYERFEIEVRELAQRLANIA